MNQSNRHTKKISAERFCAEEFYAEEFYAEESYNDKLLTSESEDESLQQAGDRYNQSQLGILESLMARGEVWLASHTQQNLMTQQNLITQQSSISKPASNSKLESHSGLESQVNLKNCRQHLPTNKDAGLKEQHRLYQTYFGVPEIDLSLAPKSTSDGESASLINSVFTSGTIHEWFTPLVEQKLKRDSKTRRTAITDIKTGIVDNTAIAPTKALNMPPLIILSVLAENALTSLAQLDLLEQRRLVVWIGKEIWPSPFTLVSSFQMPHQVPPVLTRSRTSNISSQPVNALLANSLFLEPPDRKATLWALETALSSPNVALVIAWCEKLTAKETQRLALSARRGGSIAFLTRPIKEKMSPSFAKSRWSITPVLSNNSSRCESYHCESYHCESHYKLSDSAMLPSWQLNLLKIKGHQPARTTWIVTYDEEEAISLNISSAMVNRHSETQDESKERGQRNKQQNYAA